MNAMLSLKRAMSFGDISSVSWLCGRGATRVQFIPNFAVEFASCRVYTALILFYMGPLSVITVITALKDLVNLCFSIKASSEKVLCFPRGISSI
jgi:hypothetical protein